MRIKLKSIKGRYSLRAVQYEVIVNGESLGRVDAGNTSRGAKHATIRGVNVRYFNKGDLINELKNKAHRMTKENALRSELMFLDGRIAALRSQQESMAESIMKLEQQRRRVLAAADPVVAARLYLEGPKR